MLAGLLAWLPAYVGGRTGPRAHAEVRRWTKGNPTLRTLEYGPMGRLLIWASDKPVRFTLLVAFMACVAAAMFVVPDWTGLWSGPFPGLSVPHPDVKAGVGDMLNAMLGVQATLIGLVYPITLAFMALMLQRAAHSSVALRVYLLDAAAVPVGISSVGFLFVAGLQFFLLPYKHEDFDVSQMTVFLVFNGTWLLLNILLTGFLLTRTIRFIQDRELRLAFTRIAVDTALRDELTFSVSQHIYTSEPQERWKFPDKLADKRPQVHMYSFGDARREVTVDLKADHVLEDVHLNVLRWVALRWAKRAAQQTPGERDRAPTLAFTPNVGRITAGELVLCSILNGPRLTRLERLAVRSAFWLRKARRERLSLSTRKMLEEIGAEVLTAAESGRSNMAIDRLKEMYRLHRTLLGACALSSAGKSGENAATIQVSPMGWSGSTFDREWLRPYYEITPIAVDGIDHDLRLFRSLAGIPGGIAYGLSAQSESVMTNALGFGASLAESLGLWWTRKADASLAPGETFSGTLPAPLSKVYERALLAFVSSWTEIRVDDGPMDDEPAQAWPRLAARVQVYSRHIEHSAQFFLQAVSRRDLAGASRWLDHFIKWRGSHEFELKQDLDHEFWARHVSRALAGKRWDEAHAQLWDGSTAITTRLAAEALNLAVHRYWESMRLYLTLLLTRTAGTEQASGKELEYAGALVRCEPLHAGSSVLADPLQSTDDVLLYALSHRLGTDSVTGHLNSFGDRLRWDAEGPEVPGWIYSMSGTPSALSTMGKEQLELMMALASAAGRRLPKCEKLVESWWRDLDRLEAAQQMLSEMQRDLRGAQLAAVEAYIASLRSPSGQQPALAFKAARVSVGLSIRRLRRIAGRTRRITLAAHPLDLAKIEAVKVGVGVETFVASNLAAPVERLTFVPRIDAPLMGLNVVEPKKLYQERFGQGVDRHDLKRWGKIFLAHTCAWAVARRIRDEAISPVNDESWIGNFSPEHDEMRALLVRVVERCDAMLAAGKQPVILTGHSGARVALAPYRWGEQDWLCKPPDGVSIRRGEPAGKGVRGFINGHPLYDFDTPDGGCFVVPADMFRELKVEGADAAHAMEIKHEDVGEDQVRFSFYWRAAL